MFMLFVNVLGLICIGVKIIGMFDNMFWICVKCFCYFEWMVMIIVGWVIFVFLKFFFKCIIFYFKIKEIMVGCLLVVVIDNGIGYVIRFICFLFNSK